MMNYLPNNATPAPNHEDPLLDCPTCGLPAEIIDRFTLGGVPAPVEHVKLICIRRHWFTLPIDQLPSDAAAPAQAHGPGVPQRG